MLAVPLAACGSSGTSGAPQPIARVDSLTGNSTSIALDKGFTDALTSLSVAPGVVGTAKLQSGSVVFPITGGSVRVFKKGEVVPYVIGEIQHEGSGLSLTADGTVVKLTSSGNTATLTGTKVEISPVAAPLLDSTFSTDAVKPGLLVGIATITVNTTPGK